MIQWPCYGDPTHTFSDVEREIQRRLRQVDLLSLYQGTDRAEREAAERAELARLKARFEPDGVPVPMPPHEPDSFKPPSRSMSRASRSSTPGQLDLAIG